MSRVDTSAFKERHMAAKRQRAKRARAAAVADRESPCRRAVPARVPHPLRRRRRSVGRTAERRTVEATRRAIPRHHAAPADPQHEARADPAPHRTRAPDRSELRAGPLLRLLRRRDGSLARSAGAPQGAALVAVGEGRLPRHPGAGSAGQRRRRSALAEPGLPRSVTRRHRRGVRLGLHRRRRRRPAGDRSRARLDASTTKT